MFSGTVLLSVSGKCNLPRVVAILIDYSVYLRVGDATEHGPSQFHPVHCGHGSILWHLCDRHVYGPDIHHR